MNVSENRICMRDTKIIQKEIHGDILNLCSTGSKGFDVFVRDMFQEGLNYALRLMDYGEQHEVDIASESNAILSIGTAVKLY